MLTLLTTVPLTRPVLMEQLQGGLILLVLGMGTVFVFLTLLIYSTKLLSKICTRIAPAKPAAAAAAPSRSSASAAPKSANKDAEVAAAIAAAYQKSKN